MSGTRARSRWFLLLFVLWTLLAFRIGYAVVRRESLTHDLALAAVALFVSSALLGGRVWSTLHTRA